MKVIMPLLLKHWKNIALIVLAIVSFLSMRSCAINEQDKKTLQSSIDIIQSEVERVKGKNGELVSRIETHELTISQLKENETRLGLENSNLKDQVGNLNRLVGYWRVRASAKDTFTITEKDTVYITKNVAQKAKAFHYGNDFLTLDQIYHPDKGTLTTSYDYKIDMELTSYRKGKNLFRRGTLVTDVRFADQNISVHEMKGVVVKESPKKWWESGVAKVLFGLGIGVLISR